MEEGVHRVGLEEAHALVDGGYCYVDVRSVPEYAAGHPSGAYNVPYLHAEAGGLRDNPRFLAVMEAIFPKDAKIVVGCQVGRRSLRAAQDLVARGYRHVVELRPGFGGRRDAFGRVEERGWADAGLPVELETAGRSWEELEARVAP